MIKLYTSGSSKSSREARAWLEANGLPFEEISLSKQGITKAQILELLARSEDGIDSLVSRRSKAFQALDVDFDALPLKEAVELLSKQPAILRRPIIVDDRRLLFGFNQDSVRVFLPREVRRQKLWAALVNTSSV
ncbi:Spx/MgsR family RNA polymerase-binding regulatory protein [Lacticaseibacillus chiayiensis]|uniref:Spx/MgsR family RNA polymerase-binding regulatory protein n=1 Tax=Lacticaseibacillus chiayiensis TaxID=2100821 RepID=UPI001011C7E7|nr:Spx/MgsR family RNA polymerase-binding regulatory protein [Lacticaseibacillus chiayiensis]QVI33910.1 transcriptional regulator Spx [Lacticaseibacillus chiayiensis]RXT58704.1 transcriptional regulator Spx [Lacticaseibacillus chiayiensis]